MKENIKYELWKDEMKEELEKLVVLNFNKLRNTHDTERANVWKEISSELYEKYNLVGCSPEDEGYELKRKMINCVGVNKRIYAEKIFPYELDNDNAHNFIIKYNKLPKRG